jgi:predicted secreted protein
MAEELGRDRILTWGAAELLGVREKNVAFAGEPIDTTSGENNGWQKLHTESGQKAVTISVNGVDKDGVLRADMYAGTRTKAMTLSYPSGGEVSGMFFLATYNEGNPYNNAATFEATFQSTGPVAYAPAAA